MSSLLLCTLFHRCRNRLREVKQLAQDYLIRQGSLGYEPGCIYLHPFKATHPHHLLGRHKPPDCSNFYRNQSGPLSPNPIYDFPAKPCSGRPHRNLPAGLRQIKELRGDFQHLLKLASCPFALCSWRSSGEGL